MCGALSSIALAENHGTRSRAQRERLGEVHLHHAHAERIRGHGDAAGDRSGHALDRQVAPGDEILRGKQHVLDVLVPGQQHEAAVTRHPQHRAGLPDLAILVAPARREGGGVMIECLHGHASVR